jgi:cysteine desulfurase
MFFYLKKLLQSWFRPEIYLDHASTTLIDRRVLLVTNEIYRYRYGNPGGMYSLGIATTQVIEQSRKTVAWLLGVQSSQIIFTRGGTESNNMAILGVVNHFKNQHPDIVPHIITSVIEHDSVLATCRYLEQHGLATVSYVPCNADGIVEVEVVKKALRPETILISIMYANNEIGTIQSIKEIAKLVRWWKKQTLNTVPLSPSDSSPKRGSHTPYYPLFHTDAIQAVNYCDMNVLRLGVDMMTMSGSKIYGPKGVGVLYKKKSVEISPLIVGGGQENDLRAGTECVPLVAGLALATQKIIKEKNNENKRLIYLRDFFISGLKKRIENIIVNGHQTLIIPNIVHVTIPEVEGESIVLMLDEKGIEVATGSACSARDLHPSHVLVAIGQNENIIHGSIRFSFGKNTSKKELEKVLEVFPKIVDKLKKLSCCKIYEKNKK